MAPLVDRLRLEAQQHFGSVRADGLAGLLCEAAEALEVLATEVALGRALPAADAPFCSSSVVRGHESFGCLERVGHLLPHRAQCVPPPCEGCGGLESHDGEGCVFYGCTADQDTSFEVTWGADGVVVLVDCAEVPY